MSEFSEYLNWHDSCRQNNLNNFNYQTLKKQLTNARKHGIISIVKKNKGANKVPNQNIYCVFDTETIGLNEKLIYDLGMVIIAKKGDALYKARWIIDEVFNMPNLSKKAYYGEKINTFYKNATTTPFKQARQEFRQIMEDYKVNTITAYNLQFDMSAIRQSSDFVGLNGKFLHYAVDYFDLWNASCNSFFQQKYFQKLAVEKNWLTNKGNFRTSAEIAYRYITGEHDFIESHTALEDAEIESIILQEICRQKKGYQKNQIIHMPWRKVQVA